MIFPAAASRAITHALVFSSVLGILAATSAAAGGRHRSPPPSLWSAVPGIREYVVEFENESADPEQVLRINLPADATSFEIPSSVLVPGADYQVGVWTISEEGNVSVVETTFTTEG